MSAVDAQTAWVMKYDLTSPANSLLRTTTGPAGFAPIATAIPRFTAIHFFSATVGVGVAASASGAGTWPIYRTTDGGMTWSPVATAPATSGGAIELVTSKQGVGNSLWLRTEAGTLLRTPDAGLSWTATASPGKVAFENALTGLSYKQSTTGPELYRTSNGGSTWTPVVFSGQPLFSTMTAIPGAPGTYLSAGYVTAGPTFAGVSAITRDGGASWQVLSSDNTPFSMIAAGSNGEVWAGVEKVYPSAPSPLLRLNLTVLAAKNARGASPVAAYPNPTSGLLHVEGVVNGTETVRVYDVHGRLCQTGAVTERARAVDLSAQAAGMYQLQLSAADGTVRNLRVSKTE
ncbi:T9SS type A sorting domain-containing protein [Hymenobacter monticola]|uniref:T9SS type A sorting domain-containing protein n=1 Tax=Hymenobacter monticola TaxID=1705399 RepID=A0ABY4B1P9_9BACT|nr:T9SS type A sorting domain-containing protein [Hymenobacter monticola]UOE33080.1 T9SS type A sorting domain-containing protein [Hymenobacter monticola]